MIKTNKNLSHFFPHEGSREWQTDSGDYFFSRCMHPMQLVTKRWPTTPLKSKLWAVYYLQWNKNKKVVALDREKKQFIVVATVWDIKGYLLGKSGYKYAYANIK